MILKFPFFEIIAPQAHFRSSANCQRGRRRRSSLKRLLRESIHGIRALFCELLSGLEPFSESETGPRRPPIGAKICASFVCLSEDKKITQAFWSTSIKIQSQIREKKHSKRGFLSEVRHRTRPLLELPDMDHMIAKDGRVPTTCTRISREARNVLVLKTDEC